MIHLRIDGLPPSSNHAYFNNPKGGRTTTDAGRKYLTETAGHLQQRYRREMMFFKKNVPYCFLVRLYFQEVENKGYPTSAENRYKKLDGSNRIKLLEDALKNAGGIDDSQVLLFLVDKKHGLPERAELWVWNLETEVTPFDDALRNL